MARKKLDPANPRDLVRIPNDVVAEIFKKSAESCVLPKKGRRKTFSLEKCMDKNFAALMKAEAKKWKPMAGTTPYVSRTFDVRCFSTDTGDEITDAHVEANKKGEAIDLAKMAASGHERAACVVVPPLKTNGSMGKPTVVTSEGPQPELKFEPKLAVPIIPVATPVENPTFPDADAPVVTEDEEDGFVEPEEEPEPAPAPVIAPAPAPPTPPPAALKKAEKLQFSRFGFKESGYFEASVEYATNGAAKAAINNATGDLEGNILVDADGNLITFRLGDDITDLSQIPAEFRAKMAMYDLQIDEANTSFGPPPTLAPPVTPAPSPSMSIAKTGASNFVAATYSPGFGFKSENVPDITAGEAFVRANMKSMSIGIVVSPEHVVVFALRGRMFMNTLLEDPMTSMLETAKFDPTTAPVYDEATPIPVAPVAPAPTTEDMAKRLIEAATRKEPPPMVAPPKFTFRSEWTALAKQASRLDVDQAAILNWTPALGKNLRILAGAGGGKTATLTALVAKLVHDGIPPEKIIVTTFTNRAAAELNERISHLDPGGKFRNMSISTFASLAINTAAKTMLTGRDLLPGNGGADLMRAIAERGRDDKGKGHDTRRINGTDVFGLDLNLDKDDPTDISSILMAIEILRSRGLMPNTPESDAALNELAMKDETLPIKDEHGRRQDRSIKDIVRLIWMRHESAMRQLNVFDFAAAEHALLEGLKTGRIRMSPAVVLVDEAQDNSAMQLEIARLLARQGSLILIGDARQVIYTWRGADSDVFRNADKVLGAQTLEIRSNYRSGKQIVQSGNNIARGKSWNIGSDQIARRPVDFNDPSKGIFEGKVYVQEEMLNIAEMARAVADDIYSKAYRGKDAAGYPIYDLTEDGKAKFAILFPKNAEALPFVLALAKKAIPFTLTGNLVAFNKGAPGALIAGLRALEGLRLSQDYANPTAVGQVTDWDAIQTLLSSQPFVPRKLTESAKTKGGRGVDSVLRALEQARTQVGYLSDEAQNGIDNVMELLQAGVGMPWDLRVKLVGSFVDTKSKYASMPQDEIDSHDFAMDPYPIKSDMLTMLAEIIAVFPSLEAFNRFVTPLLEKASRSKVNIDEKEPPKNTVLLSTIHKSKGLEWPVVYLSATSGSIPSAKVDDKALLDTDRGNEAERQFYVAVTRARDELQVVWWQEKETTSSGKTITKGGPSSFIQWMSPTEVTAHDITEEEKQLIDMEDGDGGLMSNEATCGPLQYDWNDAAIKVSQSKVWPAKYAILPIDQVHPSHLPTNGFNKNPAYPEGVQERRYETDLNEQMKVRKNAQTFMPDMMINRLPSPEGGPPIITQDGIVLGGNSRTMTLQTVIENHPESAQMYQTMLCMQARAFGIDPKMVASISKVGFPILVRVVEMNSTTATKSDLIKGVREFNQTLTQAMDVITQGVALAKNLPPDFAAKFGSYMAGHDLTIREAMSGEHGAEFIGLLRSAGVITANNAGEFLDAEGELNAIAKLKIEAMLLGMLFPDARVIEKMPDELKGKLTRIMASLIKVEGTNKPMSLVPAMNDAIKVYIAFKKQTKWKHMDEYLLQEAMSFGKDEKPVKVLALLLAMNGPVQLTKLFEKWAFAAASERTDQNDMFGKRDLYALLKILDPRSPDQIIKDAKDQRLAAEKAKKDAEEAAAKGIKPGSVEGLAYYGYARRRR